MYRLLLFDRDGTLTYENVDFHKNLSTLPAYPFVANALQRLNDVGFSISVITNQSGIARGFWSMEEVEGLHLRLKKEWKIPAQFYICPHHPEDKCACRKPRSGLLGKAMADHSVMHTQCLMVGDSLIDFEAAQAAKVDFALILTGRGLATREQLSVAPTMISDNIAQFSSQLIELL